jgi:site-specific DNA recombinase
MAKPNPLRCAIYTRKSSDEGLEQDFNSLDAQREACVAYIASQKHEGWIELPARYDDGGFSGGSMARPGLLQLLDDITSRKVDVIVVYKVDRLTRSLADFAKIVEILDTHAVSFVAVTQQFNTTTSMGRLTLNVLLSFAQFEREIAGERIRDKIAASKRKGMWMGGNVPLGYDVKDRALVINAIEAQKVRLIFERYLELKTVNGLADELRARAIHSHRRMTQDGHLIGGHPISRGSLYLILRNPVYIGQITHKGVSYPGRHAPIIDQSVWDGAQALLDANRASHRRRERSRLPSPLAGLVFDAAGERLTPTHTNKRGVRYRYYVSQSAVRGRSHMDDKGRAWRIPASELEPIIVGALRSFLADERSLSDLVGFKGHSPSDAKAALDAASAFSAALNEEDPATLGDQLRLVLHRIEVAETTITITVSLDALRSVLGLRAPATVDAGCHEIVIPVRITKRGVEQKLIVGAEYIAPRIADEALLTAIARAHIWVEQLQGGRARDLNEIATREDLPSSYVRAHVPLASLAPSIVTALLDGRQPADLTLNRLMYGTDLSPEWAEQRRQLGFDL